MTRSHLRAVTALAACSAVLGACSREVEPAANADSDVDVAANGMTPGNDMGAMQSAMLVGADGTAMGSVALSYGAAGLTMSLSGTGLPAGTHGIHLHEKGLCEGPKFASAGGHWNPAGKMHGRDNPQGPHLGDLPNFDVTPSGSASANLSVPGATMSGGATPLADADGTALVIHAKADDYRTDPSGDSGDRIACAVVAAGK